MLENLTLKVKLHHQDAVLNSYDTGGTIFAHEALIHFLAFSCDARKPEKHQINYLKLRYLVVCIGQEWSALSKHEVSKFYSVSN